MKYKVRFTNFFFAIGRRLSRDDFAKFTKFVLDALKADSGNAFAALVALLEPKYLAFFATLSTRKSGSGEAITLTYAEVVKECIQFVKDTMRKKVLPEFDKNSPKYKIFLPNGLTEYNRADQATFLLIFDRFVQACVANETLVTTAVKDEASALITKLKQSDTSKNTNKKSTEDQIASLDEDEAEIAKILFKIYGFLIYTYFDRPERVYDFFDFSVIKSTEEEDEEEEDEMPNPNPVP